MSGILEGVRVIDLGRYVAGPYCATLLGYLGADVIRVERPGGGEDRFIAPLAEDDAGSVLMQTGCNKRSLTLNLRDEASREILDRLVEDADVIVANLPPAFLERIGLKYERISELNPRIILTTQSAFGSSGPWSDRGGFDGVGQAMSGAAFMTGQPGAPAKAAAPYVDYATAALAAVGTLAALIERDASGRGQHVEGSLLGTALSVFNSHLIEEGGLGIGRQPTGNRVQTSAPSDVFETRDGHILVHVVGNGLFRRVAALIGADDWLHDDELGTDQQRGDRRDELCAGVADWCRDRSSEDALEALAGAGVPAGPVLNLSDALAHPQTQALDLLRSIEYPGRSGSVPVADLPVSFSRSRAGIRERPPRVSEHATEILAELGFDDKKINEFRENGVI
jgi:crotonobetainyl-CoA:carnitine CoA-transferase CaiB-like acyl-CoA transferase